MGGSGIFQRANPPTLGAQAQEAPPEARNTWGLSLGANLEPQVAPTWPKMAPTWANIGQLGPSISQCSPSRGASLLKKGKHNLKMSLSPRRNMTKRPVLRMRYFGSAWPQHGPTWAQHRWVRHGPNIGHQHGTAWAQHRATKPQHGSNIW